MQPGTGTMLGDMEGIMGTTEEEGFLGAGTGAVGDAVGEVEMEEAAVVVAEGVVEHARL